MDCLSLFFMVAFLCSTGAEKPPVVLRPTTQVRKVVSRRQAVNLPPPYLHLPESVDSRLPLVDKQYFAPAAGTGLEPLNQAVQEILIPTVSPTTSLTTFSADSVKVWCGPENMLVQVPKTMLGSGSGDLSSQVKIGTCRANMTRADHLIFEFDYKSCGLEQKISNNQLNYSATLQYDPPQPAGPIRRVASFTMQIGCLYNRHLYSYKIGYTPIMKMRKIFKPMRSGVKFILTARNAQWERLSHSDEYVLGQPMYFEIEAPSIPKHKRLYVQSCYVTPDKSHTSTPQFPVVENFGCMVESKDGRSRFIQYKATAVRFSVDAFLLRGGSNKLFMHCNMSVGSTVATPAAKSCNYDTRTKRWVELYGSDLVCACCESSCSVAASPRSAMISSKSWKINPAVIPTVASTRKVTSTTRTTTLAAKPPPAVTQTSVTSGRPTNIWKAHVLPELSAGSGKGNTGRVWMHSGPFGVKGMAWFEEADDNDEEKSVAGSSVIENDKTEEVTRPILIFEEIFGLRY